MLSLLVIEKSPESTDQTACAMLAPRKLRLESYGLQFPSVWFDEAMFQYTALASKTVDPLLQDVNEEN